MSEDSKSIELEVPHEVMSTIAETLGFKPPVRTEDEDGPDFEDPPEPEETSEASELEEGVGTKRVTGHIVFSGFDSKVVGSIPQELKFRVLASQTGSRIRLIVDLKV